MTIVLPAIVAALYMGTAAAHLVRKEYAWALVWACYSLANVGFIMAARK